jgi:hypothetical protein
MRRVLILTAACAGLAACQGGERPVAGICKPFAEVAAPAPAAAPGEPAPGGASGAALVEDCLHRWAYTLAGSRDDAAMVADAVAAACRAPLARWNQQSMTLAAANGAPQEAPSLLTGQPTNPIAEHASFTSDRALFYVVQARAGGCKPPPRKEGRPPMTNPDA